jgi:acyl-CoA thioester hydrolase
LSPSTPELPPTRSIEKDNGLRATTDKWFEYLIKVYPHQTDYGGIVWHGHYISWMEEARIECLRSLGIDYVDLVNMGCELPVVEMALRYHQSLKLGDSARIKTRMNQLQGVRMIWDYRIESLDHQRLYLSGQVTLVGIDRDKGKIMRQLPANVKDVLTGVWENSSP